MLLARRRPTDPHYDRKRYGEFEVIVADLQLLDCDRLGDMRLQYNWITEEIYSDIYDNDMRYTEYHPFFIGALFRGRYLSPYQCAAILPREIRIEAHAAADRQAETLTNS